MIAALRQRPLGPPQAIFSTLANGLETLITRMVEQLPEGSIHLRERVLSMHREPASGGPPDTTRWRLVTSGGERSFDAVVVATPAHVTRELLRTLNGSGDGERMADLLPSAASSAIVVAMAFAASQAGRIEIPRGFGFLVPPPAAEESPQPAAERALLACTFLDQKFPHRAPSGARLLRVFFGGPQVEALLGESDEAMVEFARRQLASVFTSRGALHLGIRDRQEESLLPEPALAVVRRWPRSLPQYAVGHLDRIAELEKLAGALPGLRLVGNAYHGVGLADLIREGRAAARSLLP